MTNVILVVDDNEMNRDMLSRRLKRQGFEVATAEDGQMALDMIAESNYSLVLLDVMMPRMNGYDVLETIKAEPSTQDLPVIMISAVDDLDSVVKCIEMGAEDYLFKPFNPVLLKARVEASLRRRAEAGAVPAELDTAIAAVEAAAARLENHVDDPNLLQTLLNEIHNLRRLAK